MAKKSDFDSGDFDFDNGLDMPDFDFDAQGPKDDRNPSTKIATSFAQGAKDAVVSGPFIRNQIKKNLPKGYGQGLDLVDQSAATLRNLYNTSANEIKPMVNDLKRTTKRLMPAASKFMPKTAADMLKRWSDDTPKSGGQLSADDIREAGLTSQLGEIFQYQEKQKGQERAEGEAKANVQEQIQQNRHRDQLGQLDAIRLQTSALQQYQDKVTSQFQRKSLELQYRSYFVAMDSLEEQKKMNVTTTEHLQNIAKNTALPEYVKIKESERLKEMMRNKFLGGITDSIFDKRRGLMRGFQQRLVKGVGQRVRDFSDNVRGGLSMADSVMDMQEMQAEMGGGPSAGEQAGNLAGGLVGDSLGGKLGKWIGTQMGKNAKVRKGGNKLQYLAENFPQLAWEFAKSNKWDDIPIIGGAMGLVKESIGNGNADYNMESDNLKGMQEPAIFSNQTRKTINEIIPGFLARIYQELQIMRTGDTSVDMLRYDMTKNKFTGDKQLRGEIFNSLVKKSDKVSNQEDVNKLINEIDPDGTRLNPAARKALGEQLLRDNLRNEVASPERLSNFETWSGTKHGDAISDLFTEYFKGDDEGKRKVKFSQGYNQLGKGFTDVRDQTQQLMNAGFYDVLKDIGILDEDDGQFNQRKLQDYWNGNTDYEAHGSHPGGKSGGKMRRRGGRPNGGPGPRGGGGHPAPSSGPNSGTVVGSLDTSKLESLISATSVKPEVTQIVDLLTKISAGLEKGINLNLTDDDADPNSVRGKKRKKFSQWTVADGMDAGADGLKWGFNKGSKFAGDIWGRGLKAADTLRKGAMSAFGKSKDWAKGKLDDLSDVWIEVEGQAKPILQAYKLKAGKYVDEATGKVLTKWSEAQGAIRDSETGELITVEQMKDAFSKTKYGKALFSKVKDLTEWGAKKIGQGITMANSFYGALWQGAKMAYDLLDQPCDVYVKGRDEPVLLAITMRGGSGYFSKLNKHPITKPSEIDGPVVNEKGEEVLTEEMLKGGIYDQHGKVLKTGWRKLVGMGMDIVKSGWERLKKLGMWAKDKAAGMWNSASDMMGGVLGKITGPDGLIIAGGSKIHNVLLDIYNLLDLRLPGTPTGMHVGAGTGADKGTAASVKAKAGTLFGGIKDRMKKVVGDAGGDGLRDGSWQEVAKTNAEKAKALAGDKLSSLREDAKTHGSSLWGKGMGGLTTMLDKWRKKEADDKAAKEGEEPSASDIAEKIGEGAPEKESKEDKRNRKRAERRKAAKLRNKPGMAGKFARGAARGSRVTGALGRGLGTAARFAGSGLASTALGGLELGGSALMGAGGLAADVAVGAAGMVPGLVGGIIGVGGSILSGAAALLASPVVLGALAVAAVGAAGYYGYKYLTKKRLKPLNTVRYAQYGFLATDEDHLQAVMGLEDKAFKGVKFTDGVATLSMDGLDVKDMAESFGVSLTDKLQVNSWFVWFKDRFKPVYLTALTAAYKTNPKVKLSDIDDDFTPTEKQTFLNLAKFPDGPYNVSNHPFDYKLILAASANEVRSAIDLATAAVEKELLDKPASEADKLKQAGALGAAAATMSQLKDAEGKRLKTDEEQKAYDKAHPKINAGNRLMPYAAGSFAVKGAALPLSRVAGGKIDALTCVRYKTYGLVEMDLPKVRAIDSIEKAMEAGLNYSGDNIATWKGDPQVIMTAHGGDFGVEGANTTKGFEWLTWFNYRFLPTYLNMATSLKRITNKVKPSESVNSLKAVQAVDVATAIYTTQSTYDSRGGSVWQLTKSPWSGYVLNTDVKSVDGNMKALKDAAKDAVLGEVLGRIDAETLNKPENAALKEQLERFKKKGVDFRKDPSMLLSTVEKGKNMDMTRFTGGMVGQKGTGYSMLLNGAAGYTGGAAVQHPGNGTGGDINSLPDAKGKGWAAMKDLIVGASAMAGVDPSLMAAIAAVESGFDPKIGAGTSSATGLYQFTGDTWGEVIQEFGSKYGIAPGTPPTDARANALLGAEFLKKNLAGLQKSLGRQVTDTDIYMAHFLGLGGARQFLSADPNTVAAQLMPKAAGANKPIFYDKGGRARTTGEIYQLMGNKIKSSLGEFGVSVAGGATTPAPTPAGMSPAANSTTVAPVTGGAPAVPMLLAPMTGGQMPNAGVAAAKAANAPDFTGKGPTIEEAKARDAGVVAPAAAMDAAARGRAATEAAMAEDNKPASAIPPSSTANPLGIAVRQTAPGPVAATLTGQGPAAMPPQSAPKSVSPEVGAMSLAISPRARSVEAQQDSAAAGVAAAIGGTTTAVQQGNAIAQAQLDVLKELLGSVNKMAGGMAQIGSPQAQPRPTGTTPIGPISLKKPQ